MKEKTGHLQIQFKNGGRAHYIYYGCNRSRDITCKCGYIREEEIIKQLVDLIGKLDLDQNFIKRKFEEERERAVKFQKKFYGAETLNLPKTEFDPTQYAKHVLTQGTIEEKRELVSGIKNMVFLNKKIISIA